MNTNFDWDSRLDKMHDDWKTGNYGEDRFEDEDDDLLLELDIDEDDLDDVEIVNLNELITEREE